MTGWSFGPQQRSDGDWHRDAWTVRALRRILALEEAAPAWPTPGDRDELVAVLVTARERLRRRLLLAEGVDPRTGEPTA